MQRFLVIQLARFGDVLQSRRLIRTLVERGETHLCVDVSLIGLASLIYPETIVHGVSAHMSGTETPSALLAGQWSCLETLRALSFDHVYSLNHSGMGRAIAATFSADCVRGHGMVNGQALRSHWIELAFRGTVTRRSTPLNLVDIWAGLADDPIAPEACNPPAHPGGRGLGVVLAGREARRSLSPETLALCVSALYETVDASNVYLFGTEAEYPLARRFRRALPVQLLDGLRDLTGKTNLVQLAELLTGLDAVISPDTGVMHLAACMGTPVHGMFLSSAWAWETGPYGLGHTVWQSAVPCVPCLEAVPCPCDELCHPFFAAPDMLNALSGRRPLPETSGLWQLRSGMDDLGLVWERCAGAVDAHTDERFARRRMLAESRGLTQDLAAIPNDIVEHFYQEADWMLPDQLP
jgi:ADP-heptose:LPS heptosyltransferase